MAHNWIQQAVQPPTKCLEANPTRFKPFAMSSKCRLYSSGHQRVGLSLPGGVRLVITRTIIPAVIEPCFDLQN
jgi:hypothetical protein